MSIKVKQELDPIYETILLLNQCYDLDRYKANVIEELNERGFQGEEFYQRHFKLQEKYLRAFQKNQVISDGDDFYFKDTSTDFFISFITPFLLDINFVNCVSDYTDSQILSFILSNSNEILEDNVSDIINLSYEDFLKVDQLTNFIHRFDIKENEKWKMLLIFQNLKYHYCNFAEIIKRNLPAFEKAIELIQPSFHKLTEQYKKRFDTEDKVEEFLKKYNIDLCDINEVIPTLASATGIVIMANTCHIGFLVEKAMDEVGLSNSEDEYLITCLKALSDSSKLEILATLKKCPRYATELAKQLSLTTATVSHHMNTLMITQMVFIEKENGKYYYHINEETLKNIINLLQNKLLNRTIEIQ